MEKDKDTSSSLSLSQKLKQKMNAQRLKRSGTSQKRSYLEKNKVPAEMMDQCVKALNHQTAPNLMSLMNQIASPNGMQSALQQAVNAAQPRMAPPTGMAELVKDTEPIDPIAHLRPSAADE